MVYGHLDPQNMDTSAVPYFQPEYFRIILSSICGIPHRCVTDDSLSNLSRWHRMQLTEPTGH